MGLDNWDITVFIYYNSGSVADDVEEAQEAEKDPAKEAETTKEGSTGGKKKGRRKKGSFYRISTLID